MEWAPALIFARRITGWNLAAPRTNSMRGGKSYLVRVPLIGRFNVANSLAAMAAANALGIGLREAVLSLAQIAAGSRTS